MVRRRDAHKISVIFKVNHNELLTYPNKVGRVLFETVRQALEMRAVAVGATIYFGSELWCYLHNRIFAANHDYNIAADLTGQADHLEVTIGVDLIKQKLPLNNVGYRVLNRDRTSYAKHDERMYTDLCSEHPIDLCRYQVANCYMGTVGLMNSGGASGTNDFGDALNAAVINKRAGGTGLISGRKAFQRPMQEGIWLLHCIQDVYACKEVAVA
jgi:class I fructose-bisphosphate aldolase